MLLFTIALLAVNLLDLPDDILIIILLQSFPSTRVKSGPSDDSVQINVWLRYFNWSEHYRVLADTCMGFLFALRKFDYEVHADRNGEMILFDSDTMREVKEWSDIMNNKEWFDD